MPSEDSHTHRLAHHPGHPFEEIPVSARNIYREENTDPRLVREYTSASTGAFIYKELSYTGSLAYTGGLGLSYTESLSYTGGLQYTGGLSYTGRPSTGGLSYTGGL